MTSPLSRTAILLLAAVCGLCIVGTAVGLPTDVLTTPLGNKGAADRNQGVETTKAEAPTAPVKTELEEDDKDGITLESTLIPKLKTTKLLRRQSNRLVRQAREAPADPEADTSNEDEATGHATNKPQRRDLISCVSHPNNNTIPAAHIKGHGTRPFAHSTVESAKLVQGYQQRWQCCEYSITPSHNPHAFVDGGMIFNQTDKSLRVPTCGYYHIFSQIYFQINEKSMLDVNDRSVYHLLKFERNCPSWPEYNPITVMGKTAVASDDTTTYTSDIIRLCAGGKIWVEIPDFPNRVPCCPMGDEQGTFIGAYMVAETSCHWPPSIEMENFNTD